MSAIRSTSDQRQMVSKVAEVPDADIPLLTRASRSYAARQFIGEAEA